MHCVDHIMHACNVIVNGVDNAMEHQHRSTCRMDYYCCAQLVPGGSGPSVSYAVIDTVPGKGGVRGPSALAGACGGGQLVMWW